MPDLYLDQTNSNPITFGNVVKPVDKVSGLPVNTEKTRDKTQENDS